MAMFTFYAERPLGDRFLTVITAPNENDAWAQWNRDPDHFLDSVVGVAEGAKVVFWEDDREAVT